MLTHRHPLVLTCPADLSILVAVCWTSPLVAATCSASFSRSSVSGYRLRSSSDVADCGVIAAELDGGALAGMLSLVVGLVTLMLNGGNDLGLMIMSSEKETLRSITIVTAYYNCHR